MDAQSGRPRCRVPSRASYGREVTQARSGAPSTRENSNGKQPPIRMSGARSCSRPLITGGLPANPSRALQLVERVRALGGVDADYARATLAEICSASEGDDREAWPHIVGWRSRGA